MKVYVLITSTKVHTFTSYKTARRIQDRARRMKVPVEFVSTVATRGERFKSVEIKDVWSSVDLPCFTTPNVESPMMGGK